MLGWDLGAAMIGYRGYLESLEYAKNRPQGRLVSDKNPAAKPVNIIQHTDVKRMLLAQKSYVEGALALCLFAARLIDEQHQANQNEDAAILLDLITPSGKIIPFCLWPQSQ